MKWKDLEANENYLSVHFSKLNIDLQKVKSYLFVIAIHIYNFSDFF